MHQNISQALKSYPSAADGVTVTPNASSWANSAYAELVSATNSAKILVGIVVRPANISDTFELDIAVGVASSEVVISTVKSKIIINSSGGSTPTFWFPIGIDLIPNASRVACRLRKNGTDVTTWTVSILYYDKPILGNYLTSTKPIKVTAPGALPPNVTPGASFANGNWVELISSTTSGIVIIGASAGFTNNAKVEVDIGIGGATLESARYTFCIRVGIGGGMWFVPFNTPLDNIGLGQRVSVRARAVSAIAQGVSLMYIEKPL